MSRTRGMKMSLLCLCSQSTEEDRQLRKRPPRMWSITKRMKWWRETTRKKNRGQAENSNFKSHNLSSGLKDEVSVDQVNIQREGILGRGGKYPWSQSFGGHGRNLPRETGDSGDISVTGKRLPKIQSNYIGSWHRREDRAWFCAKTGGRGWVIQGG